MALELKEEGNAHTWYGSEVFAHAHFETRPGQDRSPSFNGPTYRPAVNEPRSVEGCPVLRAEHGQLDSGMDVESGEHVLQVRIDCVR